MGTGQYLFGTPTTGDMLLRAIFAILQEPDETSWPGCSQLPGYQRLFRQAPLLAPEAAEPAIHRLKDTSYAARSLLEHASGLTPGTRSLRSTQLPAGLVAVALAVQNTLVLIPVLRHDAETVSRALIIAALACQQEAGGQAAAAQHDAEPAPPAAAKKQSQVSAGRRKQLCCDSASHSKLHIAAAAAPATARRTPAAAKNNPRVSGGRSKHVCRDSASHSELHIAAAAAPATARRTAKGQGTQVPLKREIKAEVETANTAVAGSSSDADEEKGWQVARKAMSGPPTDQTQAGAGMSSEPPLMQHSQSLRPAKRLKLDPRQPIMVSSLASSSSQDSTTVGSTPVSSDSQGSDCYLPAAPAGDGFLWVRVGPDVRLARFLQPDESTAACRNIALQSASNHLPFALKSKSDASPAVDSAAPAVRPSLGSPQQLGTAPAGFRMSRQSSHVVPMPHTALVPVATAANNQCKCKGHSCQQGHDPLTCPGVCEDNSEFCNTCKCTDCHRIRYRCPLCFGCAINKGMPDILMRVLSLAPVLIHIMPADIEGFVSKWPSIKSNLFAQVVISWVSEPCAMTYLATKFKPGATPAATYAILLDACKLMTPPHLAAVAHDITGRGSMKTAGLLAAMVGLGVACTPLSAAATRAVPGSSQGAGLALPAQAATIPRLPQQAEAPSPHVDLTGFIGKTARSQEPHAHQPAGHRNLSSSISEAHVFGPWSIQAAAVTNSNRMSKAAKPEARMFNACHRRPSAAASH